MLIFYSGSVFYYDLSFTFFSLPVIDPWPDPSAAWLNFRSPFNLCSESGARNPLYLFSYLVGACKDARNGVVSSKQVAAAHPLPVACCTLSWSRTNHSNSIRALSPVFVMAWVCALHSPFSKVACSAGPFFNFSWAYQLNIRTNNRAKCFWEWAEVSRARVALTLVTTIAHLL